MSVANTTIVARLARDPDVKTSDRGTTMCKLTLPVDNRRTDTTTWWTATLFGKGADVAGQHLSKGSWVAVSGQAHVRTYNKKDGTQGFSAELDNCSFNFVGGRQEGRQGNESGGGSIDAGFVQRRMGGQAGAPSPDIPF